MKIEIKVNGELRTVETTPLARLIDVIRDDLRLTGCKEGCGEGECGACSIILDGELVNACLVLAIQAAGSNILTIEGLAKNGNLDILQDAFINEGAVQCGFCTPGMIIAAAAIIEKNLKPNLNDIKLGLSGNLCRCTGYNSIYRAVETAIKNGYKVTFDRTKVKIQPEYSADEKDCFFVPETLVEALELIAKYDDIVLLAGITDVGPELKTGELNPNRAMNIFNLKELKRIEQIGDKIHIGAACSDTDMVNHPLVEKYLPALREAALRSAGPAIRNRATIGGNLCTASGAADLPVALLALNAQLRVKSKLGERLIYVYDFIKGYRQNALEKGELLLDIIIDVPKENSKQVFYKRGSRKALTLSRASLAIYLDIATDKKITAIFAACGSMSPSPTRLPKLETFLTGKIINETTITEAVAVIREEITPRRSAKYRQAIAGNLLRRFLETI